VPEAPTRRLRVFKAPTRIAAVKLRIALLAGAFVLVVLVIAQLVLPGIAAQRLRDHLGASGKVLSVEVDAFPAIELLWHHADRVVVRMAQYRSRPGPLGNTLVGAADVGSIDASATELDAGLLTLRNATLRKRGNELTGSALITEADLRAAVPFLDGVQPVASGNGQLTLRGTATLLGLTASVDATVAAQGGRVIVQPDVPFGGLATITVFANPHLNVQDVAASAAPDGFSMLARGQLQ
jgi:LmeA-like phospholipid-binding